MKPASQTLKTELQKLTAIVGLLYEYSEHTDENPQLQSAAFDASSFVANKRGTPTEPAQIQERIDQAVNIIDSFCRPYARYIEAIDVPEVSQAAQDAAKLLQDKYPEQAIWASLAAIRTAGYDHTSIEDTRSFTVASDFLILADALVKKGQLTEGTIGATLLHVLPDVAIAANNEGIEEAAGEMWENCARAMLAVPGMRNNVIQAIAHLEDIQYSESDPRPVFTAQTAALIRKLGTHDV